MIFERVVRDPTRAPRDDDCNRNLIMTFGINGAGPIGVQPFAPGVVGQPPGQAGATQPPIFSASFESIMAAVSRGEIPLNVQVPAGNQFGGIGNAAGNPTLLQAISQGGQINGTNGLNGVGAGGGTVNSSYASANTVGGTFDAGFDGTATVDPKAMAGAAGFGGLAGAGPVQTAPATAATGGSIADGTYFIKVTALINGAETVASNELSITTAGGGVSTVTVNWTALAGATGYKVYVTAVGGGTGNERFVQTFGNVVTSGALTAFSTTAGAPPNLQYGGN
jgi:hypothetical protein